MKAVLELDVRVIDEGANVRRKLRLTDEFVASIRRHGVLQPITVAQRGGGYEVLYGHRRLAGAIAAGHKTIPAIVEPQPEDLGIRQLVENIDRRNLAPMDVALALHAELEAEPGLTHGALARRLGRSAGWVTNKLALLRLDNATQERIRKGELRDYEAIAARPSLGDGRSAPRTEITRAVEQGRSASVVIPITGARGGQPGKVTIGVEREEAHVDLVVVDAADRTIALLLTPAEARLLGRRLLQAHQAIAS